MEERTLSVAEVKAFAQKAQPRKRIAKCGHTGLCLVSAAFMDKYPDVTEVYTMNGLSFQAPRTQWVRINWTAGQECGMTLMMDTPEAEEMYDIIQSFDRSGSFNQGKTGKQVCSLFGW